MISLKNTEKEIEKLKLELEGLSDFSLEQKRIKEEAERPEKEDAAAKIIQRNIRGKLYNRRLKKQLELKKKIEKVP